MRVRLARTTQNSLPSGSARTVQDSAPVCPMSTRRAPSATMRSISASCSPGSGLRSRWRRFLVVLASLTGMKQMPTGAVALAPITTSCSRSERIRQPSTCVQNRAMAGRSWASMTTWCNETVMPASVPGQPPGHQRRPRPAWSGARHGGAVPDRHVRWNQLGAEGGRVVVRRPDLRYPTSVGGAAGSITGPGSLPIPELQEGLMAEESTAPTPLDAIDVQSFSDEELQRLIQLLMSERERRMGLEPGPQDPE